MKKYLLFFFFIVSCSDAQHLNSWLAKDTEENPRAYIEKNSKNIPAEAIVKAGVFYNMGRCYENLNQEEKALKYYLLSKSEFENLKLTEPAKELCLEIHSIMSSQENYRQYSGNFLQEYYNYAVETKSDEKLAYAYNEFGKDAIGRYDDNENAGENVLDSADVFFEKGLEHAHICKNKTITAILLSCRGAVALKKGDFKLARNYFLSGREYLNAGNNYELFSYYFNYAVSYFHEENYSQAINWFKKAEVVNIPKFRDKSKRVLYKKLMESYDAINDQPNRRKYQKLYLDLEKQINDEAQNIAIHETDKKYQVAEKDKQITALQSFKGKFYKNRLIFSILLFLVFLLALYSFVRWKKIDYRKKRLEAEKQKVQEEKTQIEEKHQKAVDELEKVKNIVTEGSIILNDKTKIYLSDLVYVKAEDHYLHVYGKDGKRNFVRGKLSQLIAELPPNFVKCHRSYIVNTNFIQAYAKGFVTLKTKEEIPLSRNFKF
jgi:tetratricopeptide (TPR) repeat protein